jgi:tetratricopeptide (TPR) repeat protein
MVQKISPEPGMSSRQSKFRVSFLMPFFEAIIILTALPCLYADSPASKNREGNLYFSQGKYSDAEKAYLDAQVKSPGKPEILYNLGNSLIKQEKYDQGIQALEQSREKGEKELEENSWFNTGNALFLAGNYKDSAGAFIEALKLDPADRDAKHNLEMALMKLQEQQQQKSNTDQKQNNSQDQSQSSDGKEDQPQTGKENQENQANQDKTDQSHSPNADRADRPEDSISRERALQILEAVQDQELEEQRKLRERRAARKLHEKDW